MALSMWENEQKMKGWGTNRPDVTETLLGRAVKFYVLQPSTYEILDMINVFLDARL
jgi:hypothetical protein